MRRTLATALATAVLAGGVIGPASGQAPPLRDTLERAVKTAESPGGVLMVANGPRMWRGAVGLANQRPRQPMSLDRRFRIASVTKTYVAAVVLQLAAEGKLTLDDPVDRWLPGRLEGGGSITIRQLLNHTSGLVDGVSDAQPPGMFAYSNANYEFLASIVRKVDGRGIAGALRLRLLMPLGLRQTVWPAHPSPPRVAHGYSQYTGGDVTRVDPKELTAANSLVSTAPDVTGFLRALFGRGVLPAAVLAEMTTTVGVGEQYSGAYASYGLGLSKVETPCGPAWGHRGRTFGYTSYAFASADGRRIAVLLLNVGTDLATAGAVQRLLFSAWCRI